VYLISQGGKMQERAIEHAAAVQKAQNQYIREVASSGSTADELAKLKGLRDDGTLTDEEFAAQKAKLLKG
jgi:hypothetical protein